MAFILKLLTTWYVLNLFGGGANFASKITPNKILIYDSEFAVLTWQADQHYE